MAGQPARSAVVGRGHELRDGEREGGRQRGGSPPNSAQRGRVAADEARRHPGAQDRRGPHRLPDFEDRSPASDSGYGEIPGTGTRGRQDRKSTRLNSSHSQISYAVFCLKKKKNNDNRL